MARPTSPSAANPLDHPLLADYPVAIDFELQWGDMDAFGHINNVVFFRYFENARIEYFKQLGLQIDLGRSSVGPILKTTHCDYQRPLTFPDHVIVGVRVTAVSTHAITTEYAIVSVNQDAVVATGTAVLVTYDYQSKRMVAVPSSVVERIEALEQQPMRSTANRSDPGGST